jgi:uncharacterized membrane protein
MNKVIVAIFNTEPVAYEGLSALKDLHNDGDITLYATAVVVKDSSGTVSVKQTSDEGPVGAAIGALTGGLLGLLAGPIGLAVGASGGGLTGLVIDLAKAGIGGDFLDEVSKALTPGKAAVLAEVQETWVTPVDTKLGKLGGMVFRRQRSEVVEDQVARESAAFDAELKQLEEELAQASARDKAAVKNRIEGVRHKLEAMRAQAEARQAQAKNEAAAKIDTMRRQMKDANDRQKVEIEQRIAAVKADHDARSAKLEQAGQLIKDALSR